MSSVTFHGQPVKLCGDNISVGQKAPEAEIVAQDLSIIKVGGAKGKFQILSVVPSLDTPVCAASARKFNEKVAQKDNIELTVISMDLPFAMGRFCTTEGIENIKVGSDFRNKKFGKAYGILQEDNVLQGLLARAIFVIDPDGTVVYKEIVSEITDEPDYAKALKAAGVECCCGCGNH